MNKSVKDMNGAEYYQYVREQLRQQWYRTKTIDLTDRQLNGIIKRGGVQGAKGKEEEALRLSIQKKDKRYLEAFIRGTLTGDYNLYLLLVKEVHGMVATNKEVKEYKDSLPAGKEVPKQQEEEPKKERYYAGHTPLEQPAERKEERQDTYWRGYTKVIDVTKEKPFLPTPKHYYQPIWRGKSFGQQPSKTARPARIRVK